MESEHKRISFGILVILVILTAGLWIGLNQKDTGKSTGPDVKITIAVIPFSYTGYSVFVAKEKGYFRDSGLDVTLSSYPHGKATLNAVMEGEAEFGVSSETPFMHAVLNGGDIYAIATMITADKHLGVVAWKERGVQKAENLAGKRIGVTVGTNGEFFLDTVLLLHKITRDSVQAVNIKPEQMLDALMNREVDAIAAWNPQMFRARKALGKEGAVFYSEGLYSPWFLIAAGKEYVKTNPEVVNNVLRALVTASDFIRNNPVQSNRIVAGYLNMDEPILNELSAVYYFSISLEQSFILTLEQQTKWAIANKLTGKTMIPDYTDYIYTEGLDSAKPGAVRIIR